MTHSANGRTNPLLLRNVHKITSSFDFQSISPGVVAKIRNRLTSSLTENKWKKGPKQLFRSRFSIFDQAPKACPASKASVLSITSFLRLAKRVPQNPKSKTTSCTFLIFLFSMVKTLKNQYY